ncbi:MAG: RNA-binding protein [Clostridia bacterium]
MEIQKGDIVVSLAGRDKNKLLFVLYIEGENAFLADGIVRHLEKPKKKKLKHLSFYKREETSAIRSKILKGEELNNAQIRKEIRIQDNSVGGYAACQKMT